MPYSDSYDVDDGIAIVGLAGRFPGARDVDAFWANLVEGRETISSFTDDELDPAGADELEARRQPGYVRSRGILDDVELFDAEFFGINPAEAAILDPQQRVFMETAWEALERAGYDPRAFEGEVGVFAGMSNNTYWLQNLAARRDVTDVVGPALTMMGNEKDYLATRVAYKLDLRGPALNLQTACSTSLVAVIAAVQSLQTYGCDMALAGGVSVTLPQKRGYLFQEGGIISPDGHCRTFDVHAAGTVFSNGVGVVTLRRLTDALEAGDTIYAVIKGAGMNNDGSSRLSFTAPSVDGQAAAIAQAQALAGIDPRTISYVEAHGTATPLGDPIEIAALTQAFRAGGAIETGFCSIGSVKSNIGHLDAAAGVAGLIKTALALHHKTIPPTLHFTTPNPKLDLESSPFRVATSLSPWQPADGEPRRAGVSSFGAGGTNAHVVLEEAPAGPPPTVEASEQLIVLSGRTGTALDAAASRLRDHLEDHPELALADVAFTLGTGRRRFPHRRALVARGHDEAVVLLGTPESGATGSSTVSDAPVAFLFPGQGAQSVEMARALYDRDPAFHADVDECAEVLHPLLKLDLRDVLYPPQGQEALAEQRLGQTAVTQPALFVIEYALAQAWRRLGVEPDGMIGHSVGEYVAACLAGVFTRDDALRLVAERGRLIQELPGGTMLAVRATADDVRALLPATLDIAGENSPSQTVVSGESAAVEQFEMLLSEHQLASRRLATSHAFHSSMMDTILEAFAQVVESTPRATPVRPWVSSLTGDWITNEQAGDSAYWVEQLRRPVRFAIGIARLLEGSARLTLEVGPGRQLTGLTKQTVPDRPSGVATLTDGAGPSSLLEPAGRLWIAGAALDWKRIHPGHRLRVPLPTYPFERKRHWVDGVAVPPAAPALAPTLDNDFREDEMTVATQQVGVGGKAALVERLQGLFADLSGLDRASLGSEIHFLELGLDSLFLTQAALQLQKTFGVKVSFRQLLDELSTIDALAAYLLTMLPAEGGPSSAAPAVPAAPARALVAAIPAEAATAARQVEAPVLSPVVAFGPYRPPARDAGGGLTPEQDRALASFVERYTQRTAGSKRSTAANRLHLADPRTVAGFRPVWKEIVYPIVSVRSAGSRIWDVDGNEYIDLTNGFGTIMFGHNPAFIREALEAQLKEGIETGPQTLLAGEVAERVAAMVRDRTRGVLQHGLGGGHRRDPARAHGHRPREDRDVRRRLSRNLRRGSRPPNPQGLDADRARCAAEHGRQRRRARLGEPRCPRLPRAARQRACGRARRARPEPPSRRAASRIPSRRARRDRAHGHGARLRRGGHGLSGPSGRRSGDLRHPRRHHHIRKGDRRGPADRPRLGPARVHGRTRRWRVAIRRRFVPGGRRHVLRRDLRPPSARPGRGSRRDRPPRGGGTRPAAGAERSHRRLRRAPRGACPKRRGARPHPSFQLVDVRQLPGRRPERAPVPRDDAGQGCAHLGGPRMVPHDGAQ